MSEYNAKIQKIGDIMVDTFHLWLLLSITAAIVALSFAALILTYTARKYGRPDDDVEVSSQQEGSGGSSK